MSQRYDYLKIIARDTGDALAVCTGSNVRGGTPRCALGRDAREMALRRARRRSPGASFFRSISDEEQAYLKVLSVLVGLALGRSPGSHLFVGDIDIDLGEQRVMVGDRDADVIDASEHWRRSL